MLVLLMGDIHLRGKNPVARIDDLTITQFIKLKEIIGIANKHSVPIISVGDIFDTAIVANSIVNAVGDMLHGLNKSFYFLYGNHDLMYHSLQLQNRTSLGVLLTNHPKVKHISEFKIDYDVSWDYIDWDTPLVKTGSPYLLSHKAIISNKQAEANFWIANDESFAQQLGKWSKDYKLVVCGHWHLPYNLRKGRTTVINSGAVSRLTIGDNFNPAVTLLNLETGVFKRIYLESAKDFDEVISAKHIRNKDNNSENIKKFIESIRNKGSQHDSAFMDSLMNVIDNHELDKDMEELLIDILSKTKEKHNK